MSGLVSHYCSPIPITAAREQNLREVAQQMRSGHVGCVVVVDDAKPPRPIGMLTDRDIVVRVLAQTDHYLEQIRVDDIMSQPVISVREDEELGEALHRMRAAGVRRLPVVDERGALTGLLSFDDLIEGMQTTAGELAALLRKERKSEARRLA